MKYDLAIFCGNISTYHCPFFQKLSKKINLIVFFGSDLNVKPEFNKEHKRIISYDSKKLLDGYDYIFLKNYFESKQRRGFFSRINLLLPFEIWRCGAKHIIIYGYDTFSSWLLLLSCKILNKNIIWRGEAIQGRKNSFLKALFKNYLLKLYFYFCDYILYACKKNYEYLLKYNHVNKMYSFPCSVNNEYFENLYKKNLSKISNIKVKYNLGIKTINISFAGRLTKRKNVMGILKTLNCLDQKIKNNIQFIIIGNGTEKDKLIDFSNKNNLNTIFINFLNHDELSEIFTISDFFCINSNYDASPKVVNEVMNFKTPVISRDTIGTSGDLIINEYNGYIYNNYLELEEILKNLSIDDYKYEFMKSNCKKILVEKFNYDICINNLLKIINKKI